MANCRKIVHARGAWGGWAANQTVLRHPGMHPLPLVAGIRAGKTDSCQPVRGCFRATKLVLTVVAVALLAVNVSAAPPAIDHRPPTANMPTATEMVVDLKIQGNQTVPTEEVIRSIRSRAGRPFNHDTVEEDVRRLNATGKYVDVTTYFKTVPGGKILVFEVRERPTLNEIKFVGNKNIQRKVLLKEVELKTGECLDPFAIREGKGKIEEFYRSRGFNKVRVTVLEGDKVGDRRAVYVIHEGRKQRVLWTQFIGNTVASDSRLRTQIKSKPPIMYFFKGEVNREQIDEDVERLVAYYRSLGYFRARVGREIDFHADKDWLVLTFVIDEGPRYQIRRVSFIGNTKFSTDELLGEVELKDGEFFNQSRMQHDVAALQEKYGAIGFIFADVNADPRFLEDPGQLDLVYEVEEGHRYRVGKIDVEIKGEYPHTRITTVLNRISLKPGDIVDIRELRASERRLKASGLFLADPMSGSAPKIVFSPPELEDENEELARDPDRPRVRGQSPNVVPTAGWQYRPSVDSQTGERCVDLTLPCKQVAPAIRHAPAATSAAPAANEASQIRWQHNQVAGYPQRRPQPINPRWLVGDTRWPMMELPKEPMVVRGQYTSGRSVPTLPPPTSNYNPNANQLPPPSSVTTYPTQPYNYAPAPSAYPAAAGTQTVPSQPVYNNAAVPSAVAAQPSGSYGNQLPAVAPAMAAGTLVAQAPGSDSIFDPDSPFFGGPPDLEPTRPLDLQAIATETQTGRLMFGAGINSDAGLVGSIVMDEQNFDICRWPTSWADIRNATAWRGAGQRFRIEAVPGTDVQRYMFTFQEPYLMDTNISLGLSGFYYTRLYNEWDEERLGGRVSLGYQFRHDLTGTLSFRGENVTIYNPAVTGQPQLDEVIGKNSLLGFGAKLAHDTRDSAFLPTEGHLAEISFEEVIGSFTYSRADFDLRKYFLLRERPDGSGRHVLSLGFRVGATGNDTPIYDHYYAGGFSTIRGFDFRRASPVDPSTGLLVGGHFLMLGGIQYLFPITADDMLRGVVFCDTGTVEMSGKDWRDKYRIAPGLGLRITVPAMGPAPIALDFAFPISKEPTDREEIFSFFVGFNH